MLPSSELIKINRLQATNEHTTGSPHQSLSKSSVCKQYMYTQNAPLVRAHENHLSAGYKCTHKMLPSSELIKINCLQVINVDTKDSPSQRSSKSAVCKQQMYTHKRLPSSELIKISISVSTHKTPLVRDHQNVKVYL